MKKMSFVLVLLCVGGVQAVTFNWNGGTGNWSDYNWNGGSASLGSPLPPTCEAVNISGSDSVVSFYSLSLDDNNNNNPVVTVSNGATLNAGNAIWIADDVGSNGTLKVLSGGTVNISSLLDVGNGPGAGQTAM